MVFFLALGAAFSNALISVLQRLGVEDAEAGDALRLSLIAHALRRKVWLAGFALMIASFILQALALHFGRLSQVQPILVTEILFLVFILSTRFGYRVEARDWLGIAMASVGLAGFLVFAAPIGGNQLPANLDWVIVGGACVAAMVITVVLALRGPRWWRASMFGTSAAVGYAFTAAMTKVVSHFFAVDWVSIFWHWQTYALATFGAASVFLTQNAFHAGPIGASQTAIVLIDPLVSIAIGIALFGDNLQTAGARGPLEAFSLLILCIGGYSLSHSPVMAAFKGDGGSGGDLLAPRYQPRAARPTVPSDPLPPRLTH
ncbi:MAG TPA: DMT family transporter [Acidimicrobiales bacterium]|nr:DMT family transporter [Acidimicrobiales bacterium]